MAFRAQPETHGTTTSEHGLNVMLSFWSIHVASTSNILHCIGLVLLHCIELVLYNAT
jgi:hypothetical protein